MVKIQEIEVKSNLLVDVRPLLRTEKQKVVCSYGHPQTES